MLNVSTGFGGATTVARVREPSTGSRSASAVGRRSEEIIEEEDEEEVEEVEAFSPVGLDVEETVWEAGGDDAKKGWVDYTGH